MKRRAVISVNIAVLLFGLAGLCAKWIQLPAVAISFGRVLFSSMALGIFMLVRKQRFLIDDRKDLLLLICAGAILGLHWWSLLQSVQLSTVAIGTIMFSSFPLFLTFLEPLLLRRKPEGRNVFFSVLILIGVLITVPEFSLENHRFLGILTGLLSALAYAILTIMNKRFSETYSGTVIAFWEQATATVILLPFVIGARVQPSGSDLALLLFLGVITTALAHTLFITGLRTLPVQLAGICSSMETVYGILFATLLLGEIPTVREVLGAVIIIGAVIAAQMQGDREYAGKRKTDTETV